MIYLDSCALVKLIRAESESGSLQAWLDEQSLEAMITSELAIAEVRRVVRRNNRTDQGVLINGELLAEELAEADEVLEALSLIPVDRPVLDRAGDLEMPMLRTLDAIHLASALELQATELNFVTYDRGLATAARNVGLTVVAPH